MKKAESSEGESAKAFTRAESKIRKGKERGSGKARDFLDVMTSLMLIEQCSHFFDW